MSREKKWVLFSSQPALKPAQPLHGGLRLLASTQVLNGCIKGAPFPSTHVYVHVYSAQIWPVRVAGCVVRPSMPPSVQLTSLNLFQDLSLPCWAAGLGHLSVVPAESLASAPSRRAKTGSRERSIFWKRRTGEGKKKKHTVYSLGSRWREEATLGGGTEVSQERSQVHFTERKTTRDSVKWRRIGGHGTLCE